MINNEIEKLWRIDEMPFTWNIIYTPNNNDGLPEHLPFILGSNKKDGRLVQVSTPSVDINLKAAYSKGSKIPGMMEDKGTGAAYANDFLDFICLKTKKSSLVGKKVLDIGCGSGYLLHLLKGRGADVQGIDPGDLGRDGSEKYDIPIIKSFFSADLFNEKFDIIIFSYVLEHLEKPLKFLDECQTILKQDGQMILSVPNCEPFMDMGDISILIHEHYNYFTLRSLNNLLLSAGLNGEISKSNYGNSLFAVAVPINQKKKGYHPEISKDVKLCLKSNEDFILKAQNFIDSVQTHVKKVIENEKTLGIYVASRLLNILSIMELDLSGLRFYDDNPLLYKTYYPSFKQPILNRNDMFEDPPDNVLIGSTSFGERIYRNIKSLEKGTVIALLSDLITKK